MHRHRFRIVLIVAACVSIAAGGWLVAGGREGDAPRGYAMHWSHDGDEPGERAWLGVKIDEARDVADGGATIVDVIDGSPAANAGLRDGDVIVGIDGETVDGPRALIDRVRSLAAGSDVAIELWRDGSLQTIDVELGERPHDRRSFAWRGSPGEMHEHLEKMQERLGEMEFHFEVPDPDGRGGYHFAPFGHGHARPRLGVELTELTDELREHLGGTRGSGVLVARLMPGMPAEAAGIRVGDVIDSVDGAPIETARDLVRALDDREGTSIRVGVVRDRRATTIDVRLPAARPAAGGGPRA